jgi:hypothetical protein
LLKLCQLTRDLLEEALESVDIELFVEIKITFNLISFNMNLVTFYKSDFIKRFELLIFARKLYRTTRTTLSKELIERIKYF